MNGTVTRYTQAGWLAGQSKKKKNRGSPKDIEWWAPSSHRLGWSSREEPSRHWAHRNDKRKLDFSPLNAPFSCPPRQYW